MNRFFIPPEAISGSTVRIPEEVSSQIRKVLRLKAFHSKVPGSKKLF